MVSLDGLARQIAFSALVVAATIAHAQVEDAAQIKNAVPVASVEDKSVIYSADDPAMTAAVEQARSTLSEFWAAFEAPADEVGRFSLKVAIREPDQEIVEHVWLGSLERKDDGTMVGTIDNQPNHLKSVAFGQHYRFSADQISDWMFYRHGKIVGGFTIRPILQRLPPERASAIRRMLETP
jgi:uncharacterized protein YegJ (DUF2314 family)